MKIQAKATKNKKLINDIVRVSVLEEEIEYYKTLIQPEDTGHTRFNSILCKGK